jgi:hypothetical protein
MLHNSGFDTIAFFSDGHSDFSESSNLSDNYLPVNAFSGLPIPFAMLDSNGWVYGKEGLLFWVPEDCRNGLTSPAIIAIPTWGRHRRVRIDFTRFRYGTSWTESRGRDAGNEL